MPDAFHCPYCEASDDRLGLHGHLVDDHVDRLQTEVAEDGGSIVFGLPCPECEEEGFAKEIKRPKGDADRVADLYRDEISMIAFDQLLYHLEEEHGY